MSTARRVATSLLLGSLASLACAATVGCGRGAATTAPAPVKQEEIDAQKAAAEFYKTNPPGRPARR